MVKKKITKDQIIKCLKKYEKDKHEHFNVRKFCEINQFSRTKFYYDYTSKAGFFTQLFELELEEYFKIEVNERFDKALTSLLDRVYEEYEFYLWIYEAVPVEDRPMIKNNLCKKLKSLIKVYAEEQNGISNRQLHRIGEALYDQLFSLIIHKCSKSKVDAYTCMEHLIPYVYGFNGDRIHYKNELDSVPFWYKNY